MNIGIIGKGHLSQALGDALAESHENGFGARAPELSDQASFLEVVNWADAAILKTTWRSEAEVAFAIADSIDGELVPDATKPVAVAANGPDMGTTDSGASAAERLQTHLPGAHVVKTFNQIGADFLAAPEVLTQRPVMFAAGDNDRAKQTALALIAEAGFEAVDAGLLANARHLESLAMLWIWQALNGPLGRSFGFVLTPLKTEQTTPQNIV